MITVGGVVLLLLAAWLHFMRGRPVLAGIVLGIFFGTTQTGADMIATVNDVSAQVGTAVGDLWDSVVK